MAHCFKGLSPYLAGSKAERTWWKRLAEESFSIHGRQEAEQEERARDNNTTFQVMDPVTHLLQQAHLLKTHSGMNSRID